MPFLFRYDDRTRPAVGAALKDLALRAIAPGVALWCLIAGLGWVIMHPLGGLTGEDAINKTLQQTRNPFWDNVTHAFSWLGDTWPNITTAIVSAIVLYLITRRWWEAIVPLIAISLQATIFVLATWLTDRPRPKVPHLDPAPPTSGYPSGHVGATLALYLTFVFFVQRIDNPTRRRLLTAIFVAIPLLVAYARLYRGMHHLTDVLVGVLNGTICALLAWGYLRRSEARRGADHDRVENH